MLFPAVSAVIVQSQYYTNDCTGAPPVIYVFNENKYSVFYNFTTELVPLSSCGNYMLGGNCCYSSLIPQWTNPFGSGATFVSSTTFDSDVSNFIPASATSHQYCSIISKQNQQRILLLPQTGCIDGLFQCYQNGTFRQYEKKQCSGQYDEFQLSLAFQVFSSQFLGQVSGQFGAITGNVQYSWVASIPNALLIPQFNKPDDFLAAIAISLGIIFQFTKLLQTIYKIAKAKLGFVFVHFITIICQLFYLFWGILSYIFWVYYFKSTESMAIFSEFLAISYGIGTLASTFLTNTLIFSVLYEFSFAVRTVVYGGIIVLHIALNGGSYTNYYLNGGGYFQTTQAYITSFTTWHSLGVYWTFFMLIWNCFWPMYFAFTMVKFGSKETSIVRVLYLLNEIDPALIYLIGGQVLVFGMYYVLKVFDWYTGIFGSDFVEINIVAYTTTCLLLHSIFTLRIIETLKLVGKNNFGSSSKGNSTRTKSDSVLKQNTVDDFKQNTVDDFKQSATEINIENKELKRVDSTDNLPVNTSPDADSNNSSMKRTGSASAFENLIDMNYNGQGAKEVFYRPQKGYEFKIINK
ncbi:hypothetical protein HDV06_006337 [Boothiomyces sp. JEL0866]|nr:hypothetical protein HDV06_006337 [Boothiomyces sp. JEL0866]